MTKVPNLKVGDRVELIKEPGLYGVVTQIDQNLLDLDYTATTCRVVWDGCKDDEFDIQWTNKLERLPQVGDLIRYTMLKPERRELESVITKITPRFIYFTAMLGQRPKEIRICPKKGEVRVEDFFVFSIREQGV